MSLFILVDIVRVVITAPNCTWNRACVFLCTFQISLFILVAIVRVCAVILTCHDLHEKITTCRDLDECFSRLRISEKFAPPPIFRPFIVPFVCFCVCDNVFGLFLDLSV